MLLSTVPCTVIAVSKTNKKQKAGWGGGGVGGGGQEGGGGGGGEGDIVVGDILSNYCICLE